MIQFLSHTSLKRKPRSFKYDLYFESWVGKEGIFGMIKIEGVTDTCAEGHIRIHFYDGPPEMPATNFLGIISDIYFTGYAFSAESSSSGNPFLMADYLKTLENLNFNYYIYEL